MEDRRDLIIHEACGLPVELCECPGAQIIYNWEADEFVELEQEPPAGAGEG